VIYKIGNFKLKMTEIKILNRISKSATEMKPKLIIEEMNKIWCNFCLVLSISVALG